MRFTRFATLFLPLAGLMFNASSVSAAVITGGTATWTVEEGKANSIGFFNAYFDDTKTRTQTLSDPSPGNGTFTRLSGVPGTLGTSTTSGIPGTPGLLQLTDPVRANGAAITTGDGRSRQASSLDFNPADVLGSWDASSDFGPFVGSAASEQIALTSMQRWGGPFTGALIYGDFALRYVPGRAGLSTVGGTLSGLVLTSNIDFVNASFADIGNASISVVGNTLQINGDLLISGGITALDPGAIAGTDFGNFSMTANFAPVPEPSTIGLAVAGGIGIFLAARRRRRQQLASTF
jgi:hypothetical protein